MNKQYGSHSKVTATRGKFHDYLGMQFNYSVPGRVTISMVDYMTKLVDEFPHNVSKNVPTPATENVFQVDESSPLLAQEHA